MIKIISLALICSLALCPDLLICGEDAALICRLEQDGVVVVQLPVDALEELCMEPSYRIEVGKSAFAELIDALGGIDVDGRGHLCGGDVLSLIENTSDEDVKAAVIGRFFESAKKITPLRAISIVMGVMGDVRCNGDIGELIRLIKRALAIDGSRAVYFTAHTKEEAREIIDREF